MAGLQAIHNYAAVILMLVAFHEVVITQGRQIKALNQHSMNKGTVLFDSNVPTSSTTPNRDMHAVSEDSNEDHIGAYRPTPTGHSPGVGHKKSGEETKDIKAKVQVVPQSPPNVVDYSFSLSERSKTEFRPTAPGYSPGVGHSADQDKNNGEAGRVQNQLRN